MLAPDHPVPNPLDWLDRMSAYELLARHAEGLTAGLFGRHPLAPPGCPAMPADPNEDPHGWHTSREYSSKLYAAANAIEADTVPASLVAAAASLLDVLGRVGEPNAQRLYDEFMRALRDTRRAADASVAAEDAEIDANGWAIRELGALPEPLRTPACLFTVGLNGSVGAPELVCAEVSAPARDLLGELAGLVSHRSDPSARAAQGARVPEYDARVRVEQCPVALAWRVHASTREAPGPVEPPSMLLMSPALASRI